MHLDNNVSGVNFRSLVKSNIREHFHLNTVRNLTKGRLTDEVFAELVQAWPEVVFRQHLGANKVLEHPEHAPTTGFFTAVTWKQYKHPRHAPACKCCVINILLEKCHFWNNVLTM